MMVVVAQTQSQAHALASQMQQYEALVDRIRRLHQRVTRHTQKLSNIACCFREQAMMLPLQCSEAVVLLSGLRRDVEHVTLSLAMLHPGDAQRVRPDATIRMLAELDDQLTELIVSIKTFEPICQSQTAVAERIGLYLFIRAALRRTLPTFESATSQLYALMSIERIQSQEVRA
jgi:hypothetical protein